MDDELQRRAYGPLWPKIKLLLHGIRRDRERLRNTPPMRNPPAPAPAAKKPADPAAGG